MPQSGSRTPQLQSQPRRSLYQDGSQVQASGTRVAGSRVPGVDVPPGEAVPPACAHSDESRSATSSQPRTPRIQLQVEPQSQRPPGLQKSAGHCPMLAAPTPRSASTWLHDRGTRTAANDRRVRRMSVSFAIQGPGETSSDLGTVSPGGDS